MTSSRPEKSSIGRYLAGLIRKFDHVFFQTDFDDTWGYRDGPRTIVSAAGRETMAAFDQYSGNSFIVNTGKARHQVMEQLLNGHPGDHLLHMPPVADQFGVKLWPQSPQTDNDHVFTVDVNDQNFINGKKGISLLNDEKFVDFLEQEGFAHMGVERSDMKTCVFPKDHSTSALFKRLASNFIRQETSSPKEAAQILRATSFHNGGPFIDVLINGYTDKKDTSAQIVEAISETFKNDKCLILVAGDTPKTDGPMMESAADFARRNPDRIKTINFGIGDLMDGHKDVDVNFSGTPRESVARLNDLFREVVVPELKKKHDKSGSAPENKDQMLVAYFRKKQEKGLKRKPRPKKNALG